MRVSVTFRDIQLHHNVPSDRITRAKSDDLVLRWLRLIKRFPQLGKSGIIALAISLVFLSP